MNEFDDVIEQLRNRDNIKGALVLSKKENIFIAGADIREIENINDITEGENKSISGQKIFNKLESIVPERAGKELLPSHSIIEGEPNNQRDKNK